MMLNGALGKYRCACGLVFPNSQQKASHCKHCETHKLRKAEQLARAVQSAAQNGRAALSKTEVWRSEYSDAIAAVFAGMRVASMVPQDEQPAKRRKIESWVQDRPDTGSLAFAINCGKVRKVVAVVGPLAAEDEYDGRHPTCAHILVRLLYDRGLLSRCYSVGPPGLVEHAVGIPAGFVVALSDAHRAASCANPACAAEFPADRFGQQPAPGRCPRCAGAVRPAPLQTLELDLTDCDVLVFLGASVRAPPASGVFGSAALRADTIRLVVGQPQGEPPASAVRDVEMAGNVQLECAKFLARLGWSGDMHALSARYIGQCQAQGVPVPAPSSQAYAVGDRVYVMVEDESWAPSFVEECLEMPLCQWMYRVSVPGRCGPLYVHPQRLVAAKSEAVVVERTPPSSYLQSATAPHLPPIVLAPLACTSQPEDTIAQTPRSSVDMAAARRMNIGFLVDA
eukprot:m51a1_g725 putative nad-dependent protein deacetylase sirtuin- mitochondrial (453) ;mRNA; r:462386-464695